MWRSNTMDVAGAVGNNNESEQPPPFSIGSSIDLSGNAASEKLIVRQHQLVVVGEGSDSDGRQWSLDQIEQFRFESSIGSCFLQARVAGAWRDVLRFPGAPDGRLNQFVEQLNAWSGNGHSPEGQAHPSEERPEPISGSSTPSQRHRVPSRRWRTAARLLTLLGPFRGNLFLLLALSLAAVAIEVAPPMLQRFLVDSVLQSDQAGRPMTELLFLLLAIVAGLLMTRLAATLVTVWKARVSSRVGTTLTASLRNELVEKLNSLPLAFHDRNQVGMLMSRVAYDTETLHTLVHHITSGFFLQSLQLVGIGVMLFYLNPKLAVVTMLPMPWIIGGSWYFTRYLNPRHQHYWEAVGKQASSLMGMLSGIRVVKAFVQEDREISRFSQANHRLRDSRQTVDISTGTFTAVMGFVFALGTLAVWYIGGRDVLFDNMSLGSLMAFLAYLAMFYTPLTSIAESTTWFSSFYTAVHRIFDLLDIPSESEPQGGNAALPRVCGGVTFEDVSFGYDKNRPVLKSLSFAIEPGEMIGVVGRSGSGKSTLVSLIGRLYEVDSGRILIDGIDVRRMPARQLRQRIGMVPQEPFLFRGRVAENIAYGNVEAKPEQILRAAKCADAHDFIMRMSFAYETQLGEGGVGLSGGERQRLSIARALLFDPAILILDEATASVDAESERAICEAVRRFSRQRTTIIIAHRLSTLRDADRLLVFDQGRLTESGTHRELLALGGLYSRLLSIQWKWTENGRTSDPLNVGPPSSEADSVASTPTLDRVSDAPFSPNGHGCGPTGDVSEEPHDPHSADDVNWLDPARAILMEADQGLLQMTIGKQQYSNVFAVCAFPATYPDRFISLRCRQSSGRETEVGVISDLGEWAPAAQAAVRRSLARRYLLRRIREIRQVRTSGNVLALTVATDDGPARIELEKPGEGFQPFGNRGLLLLDAQGNCFVIPDRGALPRHQQRILALYFGE